MATKGKHDLPITYRQLFSLDGSNLAGSSHNATLKGKITGLEETCKALQDELVYYKGEI